MQGPSKALAPSLGTKCGRREREAGTGSEEERSSPAPVAAAVEGTQVYGVGGVLRGMSQERGPRSVRSTWCRFSTPALRRTDDSGCPLEERGGERRRRTPSVRTRLRQGALITRPPQLEDTSFARSRDPCTSIATELGPVKSRKGWRGRFGIAVGQTWATRRNRHRDWAITDEMRGLPRVTASAMGKRDA